MAGVTALVPSSTRVAIGAPARGTSRALPSWAHAHDSPRAFRTTFHITALREQEKFSRAGQCEKPHAFSSLLLALVISGAGRRSNTFLQPGRAPSAFLILSSARSRRCSPSSLCWSFQSEVWVRGGPDWSDGMAAARLRGHLSCPQRFPPWVHLPGGGGLCDESPAFFFFHL